MSRKLKILFVSHSPHYNGAEVCLRTLIKNIDRNLFDPVVVFPYDGPLLRELESLKVKTYISPIERWIRFNYDKPVKSSSLNTRAQLIAQIIRAESVDVVHSNTAVVLEGAIAAKMEKVPHVWHVHEFLKGHPDLRPILPLAFIFILMSFLSQKIVCVSDFTKHQFADVVDTSKLVTIYNGVDRNNKLTDKDKFLSSLQINKMYPVAVTVGMLNERKGYPLLLETAYYMKKMNCNVQFVWAGGALRKNLSDFKKRKKNLGLGNSVLYLGFRDDVHDILNCADFLVCSSNNEAFPLVMLEAMSLGLPVITTNWGGAAECVVDNETGYVVELDNPESLSQKVFELSGNTQKRKEMGEKALERFNRNFTSENYAKKFEELYKEILIEKDVVKISSKENILFDSFLKIYDEVSKNHWKKLRKENT